MAHATDFTPDPQGHLALTCHAGEIEVSLEDNGFVVAHYRAPNKNAMVRSILEDEAISSLAHAVWLGREIERVKK